MTLEREIEDAITRNLPSQIGEVLRRRLEQATQTERELETARTELRNVTKQRDEYANRVRSADDLNAQALALNAQALAIEKRAAAVATRERQADLLNLRVDLTKERLDDLKQVVLAVFANNRYKYSEGGHFPAPISPTGQVGTTFMQRTQEGEY